MPNPVSLEVLRRKGIDKGLRGGSRAWLVVGGAAWGIRVVQWAMKRQTEVVYRGKLEPGQALTIRHTNKTRG